jgi:FkbM family methyltransferase
MRFVELFYKPVSAFLGRWPLLKHNFIGRNVGYCYRFFFFNQKPEDEEVRFFSQNAERVNAAADMLADEKSKKIYLGMVKFRQTCDKKDYPFYLLKEAQYFMKELKPCKDETFIDCGAYTGDTIYSFLRHCREYKRIIAFEPDSRVFEKLKAKYENNPRITLINAGVYDKDGEILFSGTGDGRSHIITDNVENDSSRGVQVKTIDGLGLEKVSFIKMDVEGAELNALKGAEKTILRDKPKLAVCIYHSPDDMVRIPEYIHNLAPEYKLYVRHYGFIGETVLYAVMSRA